MAVHNRDVREECRTVHYGEHEYGTWIMKCTWGILGLRDRRAKLMTKRVCGEATVTMYHTYFPCHWRIAHAELMTNSPYVLLFSRNHMKRALQHQRRRMCIHGGPQLPSHLVLTRARGYHGHASGTVHPSFEEQWGYHESCGPGQAPKMTCSLSLIHI